MNPFFKRINNLIKRQLSLCSKDVDWNLHSLERGIADHTVQDSASNEQVERIIRSYMRMKEDQHLSKDVYLPAQHWQDHIDRQFAPLTKAIYHNDWESIVRYLCSFRRVKLGIEWESKMDFASYQEKVQYVCLLKKLYKCWKLFDPNPRIEKLPRPLFGNPRGYYLRNQFVNVGSFTMNYYAIQLSPLIDRIESPVICEIGAGYGKMAYYLLRERDNWTYLDFDIPEMIILIYYYLSNCFPEKKFLLYGEQDLDTSGMEHFDFILLPNFEIEKLMDDSCHLVINKNSFGEMNQETVKTYISHIERCCKGYFWHTNHEISSCTLSKDPGLAARDYPIRGERFSKIYRILDFPSFILHDGNADIVTYLYERK